ncbi:energy-coupling factor transporter transmembrane component T family protein [Mycoplasma tauri]|uniref:energy-coupling factor transporter transmembrane component T family protein n=1 Tax=Mycoplasma tauri TaxID=547987 RepID=UPI001CBB32C7|nr:energy-coupling factor transporter transmembrane component T [Mycoplasma tauri]MBZ4204392.1 energy-coupling factor transporter transmembrane protein EcfT [Mycoplasma tauri]
MNGNYSRYVMQNSFVHKLDPRFKIIFAVIYIIITFIAYDFITLAILLAPIIVLHIIATKNVTSLFKFMIMPLFIGFFIFWVNIYTMKYKIYEPDGSWTNEYAKLKDWYPFPISLGGDFHISWEAIARTLGLMLRVYILIIVTTLMVATTQPTLLSRALEDLFLPFKLLFIPTHVIVMIIYIALRFIPTLLEEAKRITKAQASRGVDYKNGKFKDKVKSFTTLIIPLFVSAFSKAEDLSNAMETRGYDPYAKRTKYRIIIPTWRDLILFILTIFVVVYVALIREQIWPWSNLDFQINASFNY